MKNYQSEILMHLINEHDRFKQMANTLFLKKQELLQNENPLFHGDIISQYKDAILWSFATALAIAHNIPLDECLAGVESINMEEYLK